ncbi:DUF397 domain-containing protein [Nocardia sp. NPDC050435]|uniref:DUF397 domain-containing protein n=1 Tax=Nocardia sp. NPDC050435 TaxID=3155040 RepID=UPI00340D4213
MSAFYPVSSNNGGFFKSSYSNDGQGCVEICFDGERVLIRDSKYTGEPSQQPAIAVSASQWDSVLALVLSMEPGASGGVKLALHEDGGALFTGPSAGNSEQDVKLVYNLTEWDAFLKGIKDGEFTRR